MGNPISKLREEAVKADKEKKQEMEQRLQILEKLVHNKLEIAKEDMLVGQRNDQEIHTGTVVAKHMQINIKMSAGESQELKDALHSFFQGDFINGLEKIVQLGAETVLGNASMGEYENTDMFIVWSHNALLRCDAYYYRWNFSSNAVIQDVEGVTGVYLVKRVIDLRMTDPQVLTYAISQMADRLVPADPDSTDGTGKHVHVIALEYI